MINIGFTIAGVFIALFTIIFCTYFSARLAQLKGRRRAWGFLGFLFNIPGLIIVCFLPSKRKDSVNTNPITHLTSKLPGLSKKTIYIALGIVCAVILTAIAYDNIPDIIENYKYSKQITEQNKSEYEQPGTISGEIEGIYSGTESSFVITKNGDAYCLGKQHAPHIEGQATGVIYSGAKKVVANEDACYVLASDNKLYVIEETEEDKAEAEQVAQFRHISDNVTDFSVSETTLAIIKTDNNLYMYGNNAYGQLGTGNTENPQEPVAVLKNITDVHCEATFTVALNKNGEAYAFGSNAYGQFAKKEKEFFSPTVIAKGIKQVAAGDDFIMLLSENGDVSVCGNNDCGQLGNSTNERLSQFTVILSGISKIDASKKSAFALTTTGELYAWGQNILGQLGLGSFESANLPATAAKEVVDFTTSGLHTLILNTNGDIHATGYNNCGQLGKAGSSGKFDTFVNIG